MTPTEKNQGYRTADEMADRQREISVSEFFLKNRHLLGFDSGAKALVTTVKEVVDNALDACEEAGILPELRVEVFDEEDGEFRVAVEDNGPGIVENQITRIFGKLLLTIYRQSAANALWPFVGLPLDIEGATLVLPMPECSHGDKHHAQASR